jgi:4-amino-4-deoxy-L-arabinose transferase-like glycosyltransferase
MNARRLLSGILALALLLRLSAGLSQDHLTVYERAGGDSWVYLDIGYNLMTGYDYSEVAIPMAPVYPVLTGIAQRLFDREAAIIVVRVLQALLSTVTCYVAYRLARLIAGERAGLLAAAVLAVSPVFILESAQILTETIYIFLVLTGLWLYCEGLVSRQSPSLRPVHPGVSILLAALLLGLATLTRAPLLLFPLGLALHLPLVYGWRRGLQRAALLLAIYGLVVSTWTAVNWFKWNRFVIGAEGFAAFLYIGATEWQGPSQVDVNLAQDAGVQGELPSNPDAQEQLYGQAASSIIGRDVGGWLSRRGSELVSAYLMPHGTLFFSGESLRDLALGWLRDDRSPVGLLRLVQGEGFWPKLALYVLHYAALLLSIVGIWRTRRQWRLMLPLIGLILYTSLVHFVLDAIPRYLFPLEAIFYIFAAAALFYRPQPGNVTMTARSRLQ